MQRDIERLNGRERIVKGIRQLPFGRVRAADRNARRGKLEVEPDF